MTPAVVDARPLVDALKEGVGNGIITAVDSSDSGTLTRRFTGALLEARHSTERGSVPSTAVYTAISGHSCVFEWRERSDRRVSAVQLSAVSVDSAGVGQALVDASLIGKHVVRDPTVLKAAELARCR
ncbi:hypothetical protein ACFOYW_09150 [Gryllotalpicola reticulitermitis]|uniref:Uncharacterized protein n=1 Tax=Gryllotalpicola reticulitermitis TaxID=1184153 RepID=A0ABV8Q5A0_9MICO